MLGGGKGGGVMYNILRFLSNGAGWPDPKKKRPIRKHNRGAYVGKKKCVCEESKCRKD